jgi:hypothetical protein
VADFGTHDALMAANPRANPAWRLEPDWQIDRRVAFTVPQGVSLTRLHVTVPMGGAMPAAEGDL